MSSMYARLAAEGCVVQAFRAVEPAYPDEGCGFVFESPDGRLEVRETLNRAAELHRKDPARYPRGGNDWFEPDMKPWFRAVREGFSPRVIFHSHPDVGAYFSAGDRESARYEADGVVHERNPGVLHLVVSVRRGRADGAALFRFDEAARDFVECARYDGDGRLLPGG